jgi:ABC-type nitrate/sulfonate/bicarbonate transport system permease component
MSDLRSTALPQPVRAPSRVSWTRHLRHGEFVLALAAVGGLWHVVAVAVSNRTLVPPPLLVLDAWFQLWGDELPTDIVASLVHLGVGYGLGIAVGLLLALLAARFSFIKQVDPRLVQAAEMLGASRRMIVTHVVMPAALPLILAGARLSLGVAWMAMVAAELTGADSGLGWRIFWYQEFFAMDKVMAVILTIGVLGYVFDTLLRWLQARITRWSPDGSEAER